MTSQQSLQRSAQRVLVLAGGPSAERAISLESGKAVASALRANGHEVIEFDPKTGNLEGLEDLPFDVAFIALHGKFGEDGQVQQLLEELGVPYTGSDVRASQRAMSKIATKQMLTEQALPTPDFRSIHPGESAQDIRKKAATLGYPLVVKPDSEGSSLGVSIVPSAFELPAALSQCFQFGPNALLESCITGQEWTVGLIDETILPPIQIISPTQFYDYAAKYHSTETKYLFEADIPQNLLMTMQKLARETCQAIGTGGICRVDFRIDRFCQPWILEINTIPGMTSHSLIPKAADRIGISFEDLCERAIQSVWSHSQQLIRPAA